MKKLLLGLGIIMAIVACNGTGGKTNNASTTVATVASTDTTEIAQKADSTVRQAGARVTLNGFTADYAAKMVQAFRDNPSSYQAQTTNWFDTNYVSTVLSILHNENADGFRIYFARNISGDNLYNIIIVSTKKKMVDVNNDGILDVVHEDYFEHTSTYLSTTLGRIGHGVSIKGATSYLSASACPIPCDPKPTTHYIDCQTTKERIARMQAETQNDNINIISEWFDIGLLESINKELTTAKPINGADGLRIYFAKKEDDTHCFILVTTKSGRLNRHNDYHECNVVKVREDNDNGEQCPYNCCGLTWPGPYTCPPTDVVAAITRK